MRNLLTIIFISVSFLINCFADTTETTVQNNSIKFAWGIDIGSSIDMTNNGTSTIDANACLGLKTSIFQILGVGASMRNSLSNSNTLIPIFIEAQTNFSKRPTLCFADFKCGYSFNSFEDGINQNGLYGSIGVGFNLYCNKTFKSHIILSYNYFELKDYKNGNHMQGMTDLHLAGVRIGVFF